MGRMIDIINAAIVKASLFNSLPKEAKEQIIDVRRTSKAIAILTKSKGAIEKLKPFKNAIYEHVRCTASEIADKWEKILFRWIRTEYNYWDNQKIRINQQDVVHEIGCSPKTLEEGHHQRKR